MGADVKTDITVRPNGHASDGRSWLSRQEVEVNGGDNSTGPASYITSPESDGTTWTDYSAQKFTDGPYRMAFDPTNRIIYSANWNAGVWALKVK